jgi:hypothetical protein
MRKYIILLILAVAVAFAQTEINWWVFDGGAGMRSPSAGDTLWVSIAQNAIGFANGGATQISAGYLYGITGLVKIEEDEEDFDERGDETKRPYVFGINTIAPNPFNSACRIEFEIEKEGAVLLQFFDILGRIADMPINGEIMPPGKYALTWGGNIPTGTYFVRLSTGESSIVKRVVYLK